ncbi:uncharacterized protein LOC117145188 [Drosophila mauritiana]|uniref:Uncharacterized protein LOC117145188 n=1 Tax=Drosophila mauritiana TaxID=7226 RepID=A0A6P8KTV9_DROMA|nr:uncharacterized protein LOC117145188 [Drosophila mauritiana]
MSNLIGTPIPDFCSLSSTVCFVGVAGRLESLRILLQRHRMITSILGPSNHLVHEHICTPQSQLPHPITQTNSTRPGAEAEAGGGAGVAGADWVLRPDTIIVGQEGFQFHLVSCK